MFRVVRWVWRLPPVRARVRFWLWWGSIFPYQRIIYRNRVLAWGRDRRAAYRVVFPEPPIGKTVLYVGCHVGSYCFMAASEGAELCLGIDIVSSRVRKGNTLARKQRIQNVEFVAADTFDCELSTTFDVVICLNLLHHTKTIDRANLLIDKLYSVARERLTFIVVLTSSPLATYECVTNDEVEYIYISERHFESKYGRECLQVIPIAPELYGPNRAAITVYKPKALEEDVIHAHTTNSRPTNCLFSQARLAE